MSDIEDQGTDSLDSEALTIQEHDCPNVEQEGDSKPAGWYPNPDGSTCPRWWDGSQWTNRVAHVGKDLTEEQYPDPADHYPLDDYPVLKSWKTSIGFSILGAFAGLLVGELIGRLVYVSEILCLVLGFVYIAMMIVYALVVYPSYFKEKPLVKSSRAISFLNLFVGFVIFGCIWNHNLKSSQVKETPRKGVSNIVYTIFQVILVLLAITMIVLSYLPQGFWGHCKDLPDASHPSISVRNGRVYDSTAGISFDIPLSDIDSIRWSVAPGNDSDGVRCYLIPEASVKRNTSGFIKTKTVTVDDIKRKLGVNRDKAVDEAINEGVTNYFGISYSAFKMDEGYWNGLTEDHVVEAVTDGLDSSTIDYIEGDRESGWYAGVTGTVVQDSGKISPAQMFVRMSYGNGIVYIYRSMIFSGNSSWASLIGKPALTDMAWSTELK